MYDFCDQDMDFDCAVDSGLGKLSFLSEQSLDLNLTRVAVV